MYRNSLRKLSIYIKEHLDMEEVPLRQLTRSFITDYVTYLLVDKGYAEKTVFMDIIHLKKMTHRAVQEGSISFDPFGTFQPPKMEMACRHLKEDELGRLLSTPIEDKQLCFIRDMFAFSTFTGLSFADLSTFTTEHIIRKADGSLWIEKRRKKTGVEFSVKLLNIPKQLIAKYAHEQKDDKIFDMPSYAVIQKSMKRIGELCGIPYITFHMARHNFATHIALSNGVPMVTLSKMMGHRTIRTTQIYGRITNQKVSEEMKTASKKLNAKYRTKAIRNQLNTI